MTAAHCIRKYTVVQHCFDSIKNNYYKWFVLIFSEKFNLPLAALWTAVLGDWNRDVEEHTEERIPIDEIVIHDMFHNYQNDIGEIVKDEKNLVNWF